MNRLTKLRLWFKKYDGNNAMVVIRLLLDNECFLDAFKPKMKEPLELTIRKLWLLNL